MSVLPGLRGGLIVSVQAREGSALDDPPVLCALACAARDAGAHGLRMAGVDNLRAVRERLHLPLIGIIKRRYDGYDPYITPTLREVREVLECGVEIVAFDATGRRRPDGSSDRQMVAAIHAAGALAMADCARAEDGRAAQAAGADILATTLCSYTAETAGRPLPALEMIHDWRSSDAFIICEGGVHLPAQAAAVRDAGADAVVVGTAITNVEWLVQQYLSALAPQR